MFDLTDLSIIALTFLLAGTVKGVIGLGLPTISLAILAIATDLISAMALLIIPSFITNLWQALVGGSFNILCRRLWPFLLAATATVWAGGLLLDPDLLVELLRLLGALILLYAGLSLSGFRLQLSAHKQTWAGPLSGAVNGLLTGMTGSFVVPGVLYLQSIGLQRDQLVQAMGMLFTLSTLALALSLQSQGLLTTVQMSASALALLPAILGMVIGRKIRQQLSEHLFRQVFFIGLLLLGVYILLSTI